MMRQLSGGAYASKLISIIKKAKVDYLVTVPDWVQLSLHVLVHEEDKINIINASNENQCLTISAGLSATGKKTLLIMQNQGFYNCINTIRAICIDAKIPQVFMVGQFGREFSNFNDSCINSKRSMVRLLEPVLSSLGIPYLYIENDSDLDNFNKAYEIANNIESACVLIVGKPLVWG